MQKKHNRLASIVSLFYIVLALNTTTGCALLKGVIKSDTEGNYISDDYQYLDKRDYLEQLEYLGLEYFKSNETMIKKVKGKDKEYLEDIYKKIILGSELFLGETKEPKFYIIDHPNPLFFSLPNAHIFLSTKFLKRNVQYEGILKAVIALETVKSHRGLYRRVNIIPIDGINLDRILAIGRLSLEQKIELDKWVFYALKRAGYEGDLILSLIQTQNKDLSGFMYMIGNLNYISKEEFLIKNFLVGKRFTNLKDSAQRRNSSRHFYRFINKFRKL